MVEPAMSTSRHRSASSSPIRSPVNAAVRNSAASCGDDELQHATLMGTASWVLLHQARMPEAEQVALKAAEATEPRLSEAPPEHLTVWGGLLLWAGAAAAAAGKGDAALGHIGLAQAAAARMGADRHDYQMSMGPVQVAMQVTHACAVLGRPGQALKAARDVHPSALLHISHGAHLLDVAQALHEARRRKQAAQVLRQAHDGRAEWFRHQGMARVLVRDLVEHERHLSPDLRVLARSIGMN